jgi:hypothetical protein
MPAMSDPVGRHEANHVAGNGSGGRRHQTEGGRALYDLLLDRQTAAVLIDASTLWSPSWAGRIPEVRVVAAELT